ncbi:MAG TPA: AAA family ATPase [Candidatus Obscuribacterales bacterium]
MFNVCPGCGEYSDAKEILLSPTRAVCPECKYERPFFSLPLFVITGASGSGKTTAALELTSKPSDFVVLDQDVLWNDCFNAPDNDYRLFRNTWLRLAKNIHQAGRSVLLFGSAIPQQYETCTERRYFSAIHYLSLVCSPNELQRRLKDRPGWRKSGSEQNVQNMLNFNQWLIENAEQTQPKMTLLDTTDIDLGATVAAIRSWSEQINTHESG